MCRCSNAVCIRAAALLAAALASGVAAQTLIPAAPRLAAKSWVLMDATTGEVLAQNNADMRTPPASLTKMMTTLLVSEQIKRGLMQEHDRVLISANAWRKGGARSGGSSMFLKPDSRVPVLDLLRGVIVQSGNDASIALAEELAGDEASFAELMNHRARTLGMANSNFVNPTGLPHPEHYSSARDLALLSRAVIRSHPQHYQIYAEKYFEHNNIRQPNRNRLLWRLSAVDGLKTGHTAEAGYCLAASAVRANTRMISVVLGAASDDSRMTESQKLLAWGFRWYETRTLQRAGEPLVRARIWKGDVSEVGLSATRDLAVTLPRGLEDSALEMETSIPGVLEAPVQAGQVIGTVEIFLQDKSLLRADLVADQDVAAAGFWARTWDSIKLFFLSDD